MPKALEVAFLAQMDATGKRPCLLFELGLFSTIRFAAHMTNIIFPTGGSTYTAKAITLGGSTQSLEGQIQRVTLNFDNVSKDMASYANNEDFQGKTLVIKRVYLDAIGAANLYDEVFNGKMEKVSGDISRRWLPITATEGYPLTRKIHKLFYQRMCPWDAGGDECNTDGNFDLTALTASGTADSGSTTTLVDDALTQVDDYWNHGKIKITKATVVYWRVVKDFDAGTDTITFDVAMPFAIDSDCTYVVYKGCNKVWTTCGGDNAWGPSADNDVNSGACLHVTKKSDAGGYNA